MGRFLAGMGSILLFFACFGLAVVGFTILFEATPRPLWFGWLLLAASVPLAAYTTKAWAPTLPGVFGCGVMNSISMMISGHLIGQPEKPVELSVALLLTGLLIAMTLLATRITKRLKALDPVDRAVFAFLPMLFGVVVIFKTDVGQLLSTGGMICAMAFLAFRHPRRGGRQHSRHPVEEPGDGRA
jgi:hypothetical protein